MMKKRKICVVTGTRAEYGLLYWLLKEIQDDPKLELQLIVTGMHLSPEFGLTYQVIEEDGFQINEKIEMLLSSDSPVGVAKSLGLGTIGFAESLERLKPDILVLLGDRFEALAAAQAALILKIPVAHISGGEQSEGAIDELIRHALTKMAHFHFVAGDPYRKRVIQMGEHPDRVMNFGAPALDYLSRMDFLELSDLEKQLGFLFGPTTFLVTYHPATLDDLDSGTAAEAVFSAIDNFPAAKVLITKPNADAGGRKIMKVIDAYVAKNPNRAAVYPSLGQQRYLSALKHCSVVIGNSSSGIWEAPPLRTATVNVGHRQDGRLKADSIIDCEENVESITAAIRKALSEEFQQTLRLVEPIHGFGNSSERIKDYLKSVDLDEVKPKRFYDLDYEIK